MCFSGWCDAGESCCLMRTFIVPVVAVIGYAVVALGCASSASAAPGDGSCGFNPLCLLVPALPNLDHDVDLTQDPHALDGMYGPSAPAIGPSTPAN